MAQEFVLEAFARDVQGKGASRRLRREERKIPAIVYGGDKEPAKISLWHNDLKKGLENEAFFSHILTLDLDGKKQSVILKDLQRHPYKPLLTHADFQRVDKNHEINVNVPIHFINEEIAPVVKLQGGAINHQLNDVEVTCLPQDLPEFIEVDVSEMEMDQTIHMSDLKLTKGVRIAALQLGEDYDQAVISVHLPKGSKVDDEADEAEAEAAAAASAEDRKEKEDEDDKKS